MTDEAWISAAVARYERPLWVYVRGLLGRTDRERDIVQETFLELCRADRSIVEPKLAPWLFTVARRRALDVLRKENRMATLASEPPTARPGPADQLETEDTTATVMAFVQQLPEAQREVVRLKFLEQFSYREIAQVTGLSESHVGVLLHTALQALRRTLAPDQLLRSRGSASTSVSTHPHSPPSFRPEVSS